MEFPSYEITVYINLYFSEVTMLGPTQNRSFQVFMDNTPFPDIIVPPYEDCIQMWIRNIQVSSNTKFSLVPTNASTLPPLINALEAFQIGDNKLTDGTNKKDGKKFTWFYFQTITSFGSDHPFFLLSVADLVEGLASLQESFTVLRGWSGDPCLPAPYTWDWIQCNTDDPMPRVTAL